MSGTITRILVPTDFSEAADAALVYAKALAVQFGASLHLVHVFEDPYTAGALSPEVYAPLPPEVREEVMKNIMKELSERLTPGEKLRFSGTTQLATGPVAKAIVDHASDFRIDLIVMGTHGRRGMAHLVMGSVAEKVVRIARCPVLTVGQRVAAETTTETKGAVATA